RSLSLNFLDSRPPTHTHTSSLHPPPPISPTANRSQPNGKVGPNNAPTKTLLFMYQIPVCCPKTPPSSTKSGCPSPLKSPTPTTFQPTRTAGPKAPPTNTLLFMYHLTTYFP